MAQAGPMTPANRCGLAGNRSHPEQLAASLVDCLGLEGAIHACQANSWDGVLGRLLARRLHPKIAFQNVRAGPTCPIMHPGAD